jgi:hypothetical protein
MAALKFFSKLRDAITSTPMESMTSKQAQKLINKSGAPPREVQYTRILDALPADPATQVTRQSLLDALDARPLNLKTTRRTSSSDAPSFHFEDEPNWQGPVSTFDPETNIFSMDEYSVGGFLLRDGDINHESVHSIVTSQLNLADMPDETARKISNEFIARYGDPIPDDPIEPLLQTRPKEALVQLMKAYDFDPSGLPREAHPYVQFRTRWPDNSTTTEAGNFDQAVAHARNRLETEFVPGNTVGGPPVRYGDPGYRSRGEIPSSGEYGEVTIELDRPQPIIKNYTDHLTPENTPFTGGHWDEPDTVSHYRYSTDRPLLSDPQSQKKHFHQEEFQSDWGEQARDHGILGTKIDPEDVQAIPFKNNHIGDYTIKHPSLREPKNVYYPILDHLAAGVDFKGPGGPAYAAARWAKEAEERINRYGAPPGPYTPTNAWEQLTLRTALSDAIDYGADIYTWPMGREHFRRYPAEGVRGEKILSGNQASSDIRAVNYMNKLLKSTGQRVGHDRQVIYPGPLSDHSDSARLTSYDWEDLVDPNRMDTEGAILSDAHLDALSKITLEDDLFGTVLRGKNGEFLAVKPSPESAARYKNQLQRELVERTDRVHKIDITPEVKALFKKGIPLSVAGALASPAFDPQDPDE